MAELLVSIYIHFLLFFCWALLKILAPSSQIHRASARLVSGFPQTHLCFRLNKAYSYPLLSTNVPALDHLDGPLLKSLHLTGVFLLMGRVCLRKLDALQCSRCSLKTVKYKWIIASADASQEAVSLWCEDMLLAYIHLVYQMRSYTASPCWYPSRPSLYQRFLPSWRIWHLSLLKPHWHISTHFFPSFFSFFTSNQIP